MPTAITMRTVHRNDYVKLASALAQWQRPLLLSHTKPDGDAIGSLLGMRSILQALGASPTALLFDDLPTRYSALVQPDRFAIYGKTMPTLDQARFDSVIVLDTCTYNQLEPIAEWLRQASIPKLAVDHHRTRDDLADEYLIDESAAANCLILYDWSRAAGWNLTAEAAEAFFVGIATDTGWFRHSNTDQRAFAAAADLVKRGVDSHRLYVSLYLCDTEARVRLLAAAIDSLELHHGGQLALMTLSQAAFAQTGATPADTEDIINEPLRIASVLASVLLVEQGGHIVRASFRSRSPGRGIPDLDVAQVAQTLGGGGHSRAAGAKLAGPLANARERVLASLGDALQ